MISNYLNERNIKYKAQYKFSDLCGVNGGLLSYDFYLPDYNLLIEFQGQQHNNLAPFFGGHKHSHWNFKLQQEHDKRKKEYAKLHNYNFLEIWYKDINKIDKILENELSFLKKVVI